MCGTHDEDWIDPDTKRLLAHPRYKTSAKRCYGCANLDSKREEIKREIPKDNDSIYVNLVVNDG